MAILENGQILASANIEGDATAKADRQESVSLLLPTIDSLTRQAGLKKQDLQAVVVGIGPGGFTGVRVAVVEPGRTTTEIVTETDYLQMKAEDIAEAMFAIAELPAHVNVNKLEMMPVSQSLAGYQIDRGPVGLSTC